LGQVVEWLISHGMKRFVRTKYEVNKEAILDDREHASAIEGIAIGSSGEEFFLAPFGAELSEPKQ
jgi:phage host-nuclease inhibitor protein Gam